MVNRPKEKPMDKPIGWCGSSYKDLTDEKTFTLKARKEAGHQINQVQQGLGHNAVQGILRNETQYQIGAHHPGWCKYLC